MVFTANGGIVFNDVAVLSRFSTRERSKEEYFFHAWFHEKGYDVTIDELTTLSNGFGI